MQKKSKQMPEFRPLGCFNQQQGFLKHMHMHKCTHIYVILWYSNPVLGCPMIMKSSQSPKNIKLEILHDLTQ